MWSDVNGQLHHSMVADTKQLRCFRDLTYAPGLCHIQVLHFGLRLIDRAGSVYIHDAGNNPRKAGEISAHVYPVTQDMAVIHPRLVSLGSS